MADPRWVRPHDVANPLDVCNSIAQWAEVACVTTAAWSGAIAVAKSDLLNRLIYGGEAGPSRTPCPVHNGVWSGFHSGWPGEPDHKPDLQAWWDAGYRCATHSATRSSIRQSDWNVAGMWTGPRLLSSVRTENWAATGTR